MSILKQNLGFIFKDTFLYGFAGMISKVFTLISLPLLTRFYSVSDFGYIDTLSIFGSLLVTFVVFGQESGIARYYSDNTVSENSQLISRSLTIQTLIFLVLIPIVYILTNKFQLAHSNLKVNESIKYILISVIFNVYIANALVILRYSFQRKKFLILSLCHPLIYMITVIICTKILSLEFHYIFKINLIVSISFSLVSLYFIKKHLTFPKRLTLPRRFIYYCLPMGFIVLLSSLSPFLERTIILHYFDSKNMGFYSAAAKVSLLLLIPVTAFQSAFIPFIMAKYNEKNISITLNLLLKIYIYSIGFYLVIISALSNSLIDIFVSSKYSSTVNLVMPLSIALFLQSLGTFLGIGTVITAKTYYRLIAYVITITITSFSIIMLAPHYGLLGVAISVLVGKFIFCLLESFFGQYLHPIDWHYFKSLLLTVTPVAFIFILSFIPISLNSAFYLLPIFLLFYSAFLFFLLDKSERFALLSLAKGFSSG